MINEEKLNGYYEDIANRLSQLIPCQWTKLIFGHMETQLSDVNTLYYFTEDGSVNFLKK